jgi:hypothetical protein
VRRNSVIAFVIPESESQIRVDRIQPTILEGISTHLIQETDAATFLTQVKEHAARLLSDSLQGSTKLVAAIASERTECIASQAFRVQACNNVFATEHIAMNDRNVLFPIAVVVKGDDAEMTKPRGQIGDGFHFHADMMRTKTLAIMVPIARYEVVKRRNIGQRL